MASGKNELIEKRNPSEHDYVLRQYGNQTKYTFELDKELIGGKTYVMSGWYATSEDYDGDDTFFLASTKGTSNDVQTEKDLKKENETKLKPVFQGDLEWRHYYQTITIPSDYDSSKGNKFEWHVGGGTSQTCKPSAQPRNCV